LDLLEPTLEIGDLYSIANGPSNPDGSPVLGWAMVRFDTADYSALNGVADVYVLPDSSMEQRLKTLPTPIKNQIKAELALRGIDADHLFSDNQATVRELLNYIGIDLQGSDFDIVNICLLYTSPSPRDGLLSRMPSSA